MNRLPSDFEQAVAVLRKAVERIWQQEASKTTMSPADSSETQQSIASTKPQGGANSIGQSAIEAAHARELERQQNAERNQTDRAKLAVDCFWRENYLSSWSGAERSDGISSKSQWALEYAKRLKHFGGIVRDAGFDRQH